MLLLTICKATFVEFSEDLYYAVLNRFFSEIINFPSPNEYKETEKGELREAREVRKHPLVHFIDNLA